MAKVHVQSSHNPVVFENDIHNRFRDSVYKEQGKRGLGPYSETHAPTFPAYGSSSRAQLGGVQLKRTRNLFEERVRFYLGRGASRKGHLHGISQGGLANVRRRSTAVSSRACADCKKIVLSLAGECVGGWFVAVVVFVFFLWPCQMQLQMRVFVTSVPAKSPLCFVLLCRCCADHHDLYHDNMCSGKCLG